jgi:hypothetical protein
MKREHCEPRAYRPCHKPAGAGVIVVMQPIHPKEQDVGLRRLGDAERLPAERGSQFRFECLALGAGHHRGRYPSLGQKAPRVIRLVSYWFDNGDQDGETGSSPRPSVRPGKPQKRALGGDKGGGAAGRRV